MPSKPTRRGRDAETKALLERMEFLRALLKEFGAGLCGFDPGVTAFLPNARLGPGWMGESMNFNGTEWGWLEPLLVELRERRQGLLGKRVRGRE